MKVSRIQNSNQKFTKTSISLIVLLIVLLIVFLFATLHARADTAVLHIDPASIQIKLAPVSYLLEDPEGKMTLAEVQHPRNANRFQRRLPNIGFTTSAYWLRFTVFSAADSPVLWWFNSNNRTLQEIEIFSPDGQGVYQRQAASSNLPFADRPLRTPNFVFPLTLPAHKPTVVYLRVRSTGFMAVIVAPELWQPDVLRKTEKMAKSYWLLYLGIASALGVFNLMLCIAIKDVNYLLYSFTTVGVVWSISSGTGGHGSAYEYFWPTAPLFEQSAWLLSVFAAAFFSTRFLFTFTNLQKSMPRMMAYLQMCLLIFGLLIASQVAATLLVIPNAAWFLQKLYILSAIIFGVMYTGVISSICLLAWRGNRQARFLCVAWLPMLFFATLWSLYAFFGKTFNIQLAMWASASELIFMSLALADLFNQEKKAKEKAQAVAVHLLRQSKSNLEHKVSLRTLELEEEQIRTKKLLHNILPVEVAMQLSETGCAHSARHESVSILFTDFVGFTDAVSTMPPDRLVIDLNEIFAAFDDITDACGVEKIKTIGDAYMAAAGLPKPCDDHAQRCVRAALLMVAYLNQRNDAASIKWGMRIGIHSGPVVSGVVGKRKFAFDIWGETVNIASLMESAGENGRINVSAYTCELIQAEFECEYRGRLNARDMRMMDMYFVVQAL